jgi:hypothetical protein
MDNRENPYQAPRELGNGAGGAQWARVALAVLLVWLLAVSPFLAVLYYARGWVSVTEGAWWGIANMAGAIPAIYWSDGRPRTKRLGFAVCIITMVVLLGVAAFAD